MNPMNKPGRMMQVSPNVIQVDPQVQRRLNVDRAARIARSWDWAAYQPISVSRRPDGSMVVFDGMHRLHAALALELRKIPIYLVELSSVQIEARSMLEVNGPNRARVSQFDKHRIGRVANIAQTLAIERAVSASGLSLVEGQVEGPNETNAIGTIYAFVGRRTPETIENELKILFQTLKHTWPGDKDALTGRFVGGMLRTLQRIGFNEGGRKLLARPERLGQRSARYYLDAAQTAAELSNGGGTVVKHLPPILMSAFNKHLPEESRI
jgi:hypothetical protein